MTAWHATLSARWQALQSRERAWLLAGAAVLGAALLWWVAIAPAWQTLRSASAQHTQLDAEIQRMQAQQAQARQLQQQAQAPTRVAPNAVEEAVQRHLGSSAKVERTGTQIQVTVQNASTQAVTRWLAEVRANAHAEVQQAQLQRSESAGASLWRGSFTLKVATP